MHSYLMEISDVCVYFVLIALSFAHAWLCEPWLPPEPTTCHIEIIFIFTLDHIKGDSYG
jgi:hypothetical protein